MISNNVGKWALECKVNDHFMAGMKAHYDVKACGHPKAQITKTGVTRQYFIGIIEVDWNYANSARNLLTGDLLDKKDK